MIFSALRCSNGITYVQTYNTDEDPALRGASTIAEIRKASIKVEAGNMNCYDWREGLFPDHCLWRWGTQGCSDERPHGHIAWCEKHFKKIMKRDM